MGKLLRLTFGTGRMVEPIFNMLDCNGYGSEELREEIARNQEVGKATTKLAKNEYWGKRAILSIRKGPRVAESVAEGVADMGIMGGDSLGVFYDENPPKLGRAFDAGDIGSGYGFQRMYNALIGLPDKQQSFIDKIANKKRIILASSYMGDAMDFFAREFPEYDERFIDPMKLSGQVEYEVASGSADVGFELVSSGRALKNNGLIEYKEAGDIPVKVLINKATRYHNDEAERLFEQLKLGVLER